MSEEFGAVVKRSYGSTETPTITSSFPGDPPEMGWATDGRAIGDVELEVRDPASGHPVPDGEEGELSVRGPELAEGYLDRHQTDAAFVDGWYRTSDLATVDDGWLRIVGRSADVIIRGGMNVSASEVEQALERHPSVREAVVVGYPDDIYDERIGAFVVVDRSGAGVPLDRASWVEWFATVGVTTLQGAGSRRGRRRDPGAPDVPEARSRRAATAAARGVATRVSRRVRARRRRNRTPPPRCRRPSRRARRRARRRTAPRATVLRAPATCPRGAGSRCPTSTSRRR